MAEQPKVLVTATPEIPRSVVAQTPRDMSDVRLVVRPALYGLAVRVARTYLQAVLGILLGAAVPATGLLPDPLPPMDAGAKLAAALGLALFPAAVALLWNALELLGKLEQSHPEWRG
jgi:hypothetical protein